MSALHKKQRLLEIIDGLPEDRLDAVSVFLEKEIRYTTSRKMRTLEELLETYPEDFGAEFELEWGEPVGEEW